MNLIFENPVEAAKEFAAVLAQNEELKDHIIIGNSIKNIPFIETIAQELGLFYDLLFNKGIYTPDKECQIAKISETKDIVCINELVNAFEISQDYILSTSRFCYDDNISKKILYFRAGLPLSELKGADVLVLDQGSNTGLTLNLCHKSLLNLGVKSIKYASAIIASDLKNYYVEIFDKVYCLREITHFIDKDYYYKQPLEISYEYAREILHNSQYFLPFQRS